MAKLTDGTNDNSVLIFHNQFPAVNLKIQRSKTNDSLKINEVVQGYVMQKSGMLPASLFLVQHGIQADLISQRIQLMVTNGISGLIIVLLVLFLLRVITHGSWATNAHSY